MLKGKTIEQAKLIKDKEIADALELPAIKLHCSVLAEEGINIEMITQGASEINISCVILQSQTSEALKSIHRAFLENQ